MDKAVEKQTAGRMSRRRALLLLERLEALYPDAQCALHFQTPLQLLVATILSAQCTDLRVNQVTPDLFSRYPDAPSLAAADPVELEDLIRSTGFFRNKAKNLIGCARALVERHTGEVPQRMEELVALPGVGRKTANVILGNIFATPGMVVDTHVKRLAGRFGWTRESDPVRIEKDLCRLLPEERWTQTSHVLILHGRALCKAPIPHCSRCPVVDLCPRIGVGRSH
ncbi:endonuclease III [Trichloromonas sp.]|uniref:endonuclease III n=1 Tax=Trichloromonas sp. TaxID=3069249 RepID=UPI002A4DAF40|nr:endonuclease III [Trichloromonas sp.]